MDGIKPRPSKISRALRDAIAYCKMMFEAEMSCEVPGTKPTPPALKWRERATEYNIVLKKIEPHREGKKGPAGEKPQVAPPPGASA